MGLLRDAMENDKDNLIEKFRGVYGFRVKRPDGKEGYWVVNAKTGKGTIEYDSKRKFKFVARILLHFLPGPVKLLSEKIQNLGPISQAHSID